MQSTPPIVVGQDRKFYATPVVPQGNIILKVHLSKLPFLPVADLHATLVDNFSRFGNVRDALLLSTSTRYTVDKGSANTTSAPETITATSAINSKQVSPRANKGVAGQKYDPYSSSQTFSKGKRSV